ncbi:proton-coupled amino acid transporter-like protein CG1139 [Aedes aegypti]|uniref:Amino acid transporter transmembrane domain-containing protein n=1 Tax=Aedes aegypti TaxID=7159 RepID=A0A6I8TSD6_AEDAE|nr:proton-coupled amino acid transporter-like protein CG1139 [Aedes aegypti]
MPITVESLEKKDAEEYDPFAHRQIKKPNTTIGSFIHLVKGSLGTGIMAMPLAFKNGGLLFGTIGSIVICIIYAHCVHLLVGTSQKLCRKTQTPVLDYAGTAHKAFETGPQGIKPMAKYVSIFIDWMLVIDSILSICLYIVFIAESMQGVIYNQQGLDWDTRMYILILMIPIVIIMQVRELKQLVPFTAVANMLIIASVGVSLYFIFSEPISLADRNLWPQWTTFPSFVSTVLFAIAGIKTVLPIENKMKHPGDFLRPLGVMQSGLGILTVLYGVTGFFGYAQYGEITKGSVTLNLPSDSGWAETTRLLSAIGILVSLGFTLYIPMEIIWPRLEAKISLRWHNVGQITIRTGLAISMVGFALVAPKVESFIGLLGSFGTAVLSVLLPVTVDTLYRWPTDFGWCRWRLVKNSVLILFGLFVLTVGTYFGILDIVAIYK